MYRLLSLYDFQIELIKSLNKGGFENSQMLLERNSRPIRPVNHRVIRTNINFVSMSVAVLSTVSYCRLQSLFVYSR